MMGNAVVFLRISIYPKRPHSVVWYRDNDIVILEPMEQMWLFKASPMFLRRITMIFFWNEGGNFR